MIDTLVKIGAALNKGSDEWDQIIDKVEPSKADKKGNPITNYVLEIAFDLDEGRLIIDRGNSY